MRVSVVVAALGLTIASGCSTSGKPAFAVGASTTPEPSTTCPFGVRGARVSLVDIEGGSQITLRAFGDVEQVRRRARDAAAMYGPGAHRGLGHHGEHGMGQQHGLGLGRLGVAVVASAEDTPDGARIIVRPQSPADLEKMRVALVDREARTRGGDCR